jgi:hypothetical protein
MNKVIALVLALSLMAAMVFAEPVVAASEIIQTTSSVSEAKGVPGSLFADISAPQLATSEAEAIEGEGPGGAVLGFVVGTYLATKAAPAISSSLSKGMINPTSFNVGGVTAIAVTAIIGGCTAVGSLLPF